jgi:hypothetical protein
VQHTYFPQQSEQDRIPLVIAYRQVPGFNYFTVIMYIKQSIDKGTYPVPRANSRRMLHAKPDASDRHVLQQI